MGEVRRWSRPVAIAVIAAALVAVLALRDPSQPGNYPACPFRWSTALWCPGCGSMRAIHALLHGHVMTALSSNALTVAMLPVLAGMWWGWARSTVAGAPPAAPASRRTVWAWATLAFGFAIARQPARRPGAGAVHLTDFRRE